MSRLTRRKLLKAASVAGATGVAGCLGGEAEPSGDNNGGGTGEDPGERPEEHEEILDYWLDQAQDESGPFKFYTAMPIQAANFMMTTFRQRFDLDEGEVFRGVTGEVYTRFIEESQVDEDTADIIMLGDGSLHLDMRDNGQLLAYEPNQQQYYPDNLTAEHWTCPRVLTWALAWNTDLIDDTAAEDLRGDWSDIGALDPDDWNGVANIGDPYGGGAYQWYHGMDLAFGDEFWEWVEHWLLNLEAVPHQPHGVMQSEMMSGENPLSLAQLHYRINELLEADPETPVDWHIPEGEYGGTPIGVTAMSITSETERPATAKLFTEWALSGEGVGIIQQADFGYTSRNPPAIEWTHVPATFDEIDTLPIDFARQANERERIQTQFDEILQ